MKSTYHSSTLLPSPQKPLCNYFTLFEISLLSLPTHPREVGHFYLVYLWGSHRLLIDQVHSQAVPGLKYNPGLLIPS